VIDELRHGDLYCNPALIETFGVAELEAMALGLCVVSNTGFGKHTHVEPLVSGVTVPLVRRDGLTALDEPAWTHKLVCLASDPALRQRLGAAARALARNRYHVDRMATDIVAVFDEAIARQTPEPAAPNVEEEPA
jgi:glycosyltransferase involved in cell wall biosynthesis